HGDERGAATRAAFVDRPCEEFLPGPRLADDQGARVAVWQESGRPGQILLDGLALAHDGGERVRVTVRAPDGPRPVGVDRGGDRAQSRHGNTSSATQLPPRPFARYSARSAAAMSRASEEPRAARERSARPPLTVTLIGASDAPTLSQIRSATSRAARASVSGRMTANSSPP